MCFTILMWLVFWWKEVIFKWHISQNNWPKHCWSHYTLLVILKNIWPQFYINLITWCKVDYGMKHHSNVLRPPKKIRFWSLRASPQTCGSAFLIFSFFFLVAMKRCPIAAKVAGSIGIRPYCVLNDFSHTCRGMNVCLICEASLSHHTLYMGNLGPRVYNVSYITLLAKQKYGKKKAHHHTDFEANRWPETGDFFGGA